MNHNTASNFMNANGSGDSKMKRDILLSEIAKIIVGNPRLVVFHLRNSGFKVENNPSKSTLVTIVSNALNKSKKFATKMAHEILGNTYGATGDVAAGDAITTPIVSAAPPAIDPTVKPTTSTLTQATPPSVSEPIGTTAPTAPRTAPASTAPTKTVDVSTPPLATTTSTSNETVRPAPAGPPTIILPIVSSLGSIFGGAPTYGPSGGGGGGGGGEASSAEADLRSKTNAITDLDGKMKKRKKIIGFSLLFIVLAGGTYYYYTHNK